MIFLMFLVFFHSNKKTEEQLLNMSSSIHNFHKQNPLYERLDSYRGLHMIYEGTKLSYGLLSLKKPRIVEILKVAIPAKSLAADPGNSCRRISIRIDIH